MSETREAARGYTLALALRHLPMSVTRTRQVVAEIGVSGIGWGGLIGLVVLQSLPSLIDSVLRDVLWPEPGFEELRSSFGEWGFRLVAVLVLAAATVFVACFAIIVMKGMFRLFSREASVWNILVGTAAAGFVSVIGILLISAVAIISHATGAVSAEDAPTLFGVLDALVVGATVGYLIVAISAATAVPMGPVATALIVAMLVAFFAAAMIVLLAMFPGESPFDIMIELVTGVPATEESAE